MSPNKLSSQIPQFTLSRLSSSAAICGFALVSAVAQAASCDYLPGLPADTQISQCQASAEAAVGKARSEVAKAAFDAGFMLETAENKPNLELSARYYQIAADLGSPGAQYNLANQIVRVGGDMSEAAKYYRMAAKQGAKLAQYNLATQYLTGQGVSKDPQKAYLWFRTAAGLGLAAAQFELASMFEQGLGVDKNIPSAIGWYELAAEQGYAPAQQRLNNLKKNLTIEPESPKGLFGGLLIPRTPRQTLSFDPDNYSNSEFKSEVAAQTSDFEADKTGSTDVANEDGVAGFFSSLIKRKSRSNPLQDVRVDPQIPNQTADLLASTTTQPVETIQTATPALIALDKSPIEAKALSDSSASAAHQADLTELQTQTSIQSQVKAKGGLVKPPELSEKQTNQIAELEVENTLTEEALSAEVSASDVAPTELPAAEVLTSALPAADLPEPAQIPLDAQSSQGLVNQNPATSAFTPSANFSSRSTEQNTQATATPMAIEAAPEQLLAANAQSPEELEKILQDLPTYQVERPEFPAERAYLRAAESGSEMAQLALANAYAQGKGVPADSEAAAKWYLRAARQGNADASLNLALSYKLGNGLKKNNQQALKWFKHSAFRGNAQALYNLGAMYASGIGTDIDETLAARYFSQSANLGYEPAKNALAFLNR